MHAHMYGVRPTDGGDIHRNTVPVVSCTTRLARGNELLSSVSVWFPDIRHYVVFAEYIVWVVCMCADSISQATLSV